MPLTPNMIVAALRSLGQPARAPQIYDEIVKIFPHETLGKTPVASIRARLQENCPDSSQFTKRQSLFYRVTPVEMREGIWWLQEDEQTILDEVEAFMVVEGRRKLRLHLVRERSSKLINQFKNSLESYACSICGFDFEKVYGEIGQNFIEAHHKVPLASTGPTKTRIEDLIPVCSNCHRMLHRNGNVHYQELKIEIEKQKFIQNNKN